MKLSTCLSQTNWCRNSAQNIHYPK